jgi:surface protein
MKKLLLIIISLVSINQTIAQADAFITTWVTTTGFETITLSAQPDAPNYTINWGDGLSNTYIANQTPSHTYINSGEHTVSFTGTFPHLNFNGQTKLKAVQQWGTQKWTSMANMFQNCTTLNSFPTQAPDLSLCTNMSYMFLSASAFNQPIGSWDVSRVTNMFAMFYGATAFNQNIGSWNVSKVTDMNEMFFGTKLSTANYDDTLIGWATRGTNGGTLQYGVGFWGGFSNYCNGLGARNYLTNTYGWTITDGGLDCSSLIVLDTNGVTLKYTGTTVPSTYLIQASPRGTLEWFAIVDNNTKSNITNYAKNIQSGITYFTPTGSSTPIPFNNIVTTLVTDMNSMFYNATAFNQPLGSWDVSNVTNMQQMFGGATAFNQAIGSWDVSNVTNMRNMFAAAKLSTANYDELLIGWSTISPNKSPLKPNVTFSGGNSKFCNGASGRAILTSAPNNWTITDGGLDCSSLIVLDTNGVTLKYTGTTVPSTYLIQASPRGTLEWFVIVDNTTKSNITDYAKNIQSGITYFTPPDESSPIPFDNIVTTLVTDMNNLFLDATSFNQPINSWDVSNVTNMSFMFSVATSFNQPLGSWDVSKVTNMEGMFSWTGNFNQDISNWDVSNVTNMSQMFGGAEAFNQPIGSWNVSNVTTMYAMFNVAKAFNQPIGSWDVSNVTNMQQMFGGATAFNQAIGSWDVSKVTNMALMFNGATFNQAIGSWNVSNVTSMQGMFYVATAFNQAIGSWDVSKVTTMSGMFLYAFDFNQPISSWNVSSVTSMFLMFAYTATFNQPIDSWNVSNVTNMQQMFYNATAFNQPIGSWNVSNVTTMSGMFAGAKLSTANYDVTLIGWSTITSTETALQPNVTFDAGTSKYCNGASARSILTSAPNNWTITDSGQDCTDLSTEKFDTSSLKLYPNPVISVLNVDNNLTNQPYAITDALGKIILKGKLNEGDNSINVEQLSKGIYYLKVANNKTSKFIKE